MATATVLLDTTGGIPSWRRLQLQHLEHQRVTGGHFYQHHQQQCQHVLYQDHCQHNVLPPLSIVGVHRKLLSIVRTSVLLKGPAGLGWHMLLLQASSMVLLLLLMTT